MFIWFFIVLYFIVLINPKIYRVYFTGLSEYIDIFSLLVMIKNAPFQ